MFKLAKCNDTLTSKDRYPTRFGRNTSTAFSLFSFFSFSTLFSFLSFIAKPFEQVVCSLSLHLTSCLLFNVLQFIFHHKCFAELALPNFTQEFQVTKLNIIFYFQLLFLILISEDNIYSCVHSVYSTNTFKHLPSRNCILSNGSKEMINKDKVGVLEKHIFSCGRQILDK